MKIDAGPFRFEGSEGGPAVLCIHGLTGTPYEVRPPAEELASRGFACWGPLLPGHGSTPEECARVPWQNWVDSVGQAWDELAKRHDRVYVLGLSLGGVLALRLCQSRSVAGGVILAAPLRLGALLRYGVPLLHRLVPQVAKTPGIRDSEARERHPGYDRMPMASVAQLLLLQREVERDLDRITAPLQLIYSRLDETVALENADRIRAGVGSASVETHLLERSGHVFPVDHDRDLVASRVADFLQQLERGAIDAPLEPGES